MWEEDEWGYCPERDRIPDPEEDDSCLKSVVILIGGFLVFAGAGWALFGILKTAGYYIIALFWIVVAVIIFVKLFNLTSK